MASLSNGMDVASILQRLTHSPDFDVVLLDQLVAAAYDPMSPHRADANKALMQLQGIDGMWQKADSIMEQSQNPSARFFGLQILDDAIKTRYAAVVACRVVASSCIVV
jgi:exportin-1